MNRERIPPRYQQVARSSVRHAHAGHLYAHHIRRLPSRLRALIDALDLRPGARVLDYGCADMPYRSAFGLRIDYVPADLDGNADAQVILRDDGTVPEPEASFDAVLSTQVLEHVEDPELYLREAFRVLRPGGKLLLSTHGVFPYHPDPVDFWRWTGAGLQRAIENAGFEVVAIEGIIGMAATGLQLLQDAISYRIHDRWKPRLAFVMQPLVAFADRFETPESLGDNAQVFAVIAVRPT